MTRLIYLVEAVAYNLSSGLEETLFFASAEFATGRADTPADRRYWPRVKGESAFAVAAFDGRGTRGASRPGAGPIALDNTDGALDGLSSAYALAGRAVTVRVGEAGAPYPAGYPAVIAGVMEQPDAGLDQVLLRLRDGQVVLDKPAQSVLYAGTGGLEGAADLAGKGKPCGVGGTSRNVEPALVNPALDLYQAADGAVYAIGGVYDRQVAYTPGADYASQEEMETTAPAAGTFRAWNTSAGAYFRVGTPPSGMLTCDVTWAAAAERTTAQVWRSLLIQRGGVAAGMIDAADVAALDAANAAEIELHLPCGDTRTVHQLLDEAAQGAGAYWWADALGVYHLRRLEEPAGAAGVTLRQSRILELERVLTSDTDRGLPAWRAEVRYDLNYSPTQEDIDNSAPAARRAWAKEEYRVASAADAAVKTPWPTAAEVTVDSHYADAVGAQAEADRLLALYRVPRQSWRIKARLSAAEIAALDVGAVAAVDHPRYGLSGKLWRVLGLERDYRQGIVTVTVWG